jgi:site-specific DNA-cytosine methylase
MKEGRPSWAAFSFSPFGYQRIATGRAGGTKPPGAGGSPHGSRYSPLHAGPLYSQRDTRFSGAELKRVCSFPDDFVLTGTFAQKWERLGRSVPPLMMRSIAMRVAEILKRSEKERKAICR